MFIHQFISSDETVDVGQDLNPDGTKKKASKSSGSNQGDGSTSKSNDGGEAKERPSQKEKVSPTSRSSSPSLDARAAFGTNLFLLSGMELGHVMTILEVECPEVLENCTSGGLGEPSKVEIVVDSIPPEIFASLNSYVNNRIGGSLGKDGNTKNKSSSAMSSGTGGGISDDDYISGGGSKSKKKRKTI